MMRRHVILEDTTLREGEQTPGVAFTAAQKEAIVAALVDAGIRHVEVGTPTMGSQEREAIERLCRAFPDITLIGWNRGVRSDLDCAFEMGLSAVHIGLPSSDLHIHDKFHRSRAWVLDTAAELIAHAKAQGASFVSVSAEDMGRADIDFLKEYARTVAGAGATRLRLSDTVGCLTPARVAGVVAALRREVDIDLQLHMHNDFNLALANVMAGVEAGATQVHVTVNGLGERAGIASLHQVAVALHVLLGVDTGVALARLPRLGALVAEASGLPIAHNEPILGDHVFRHESGIHVDGLLKVKESFEAFPPELVGRRHEFVIGKHSGSHAIAHLLGEAGITIGREQARQLLPALRELAPLLGGAISVPVAAALARLRFPSS